MPRIQCRNCGKLIEVRPDDAGAVFVCAACGTRNESPLIGQNGQAWAAIREAVEKDAKRWKKGIRAEDLELEALAEAAPGAVEITDSAAEAAPTAAPVVFEAAPALERIRFGSPLAWAICVVLVTLAIVLPFAISKWSEPKKADYSDLMAMQQKAESLAAAGDLPGAHEAYGILIDKANERPVDDPLVLERLAKAKRDEQRVAKILSDEERREERQLREASVVMVAPATAPAIVVAKIPEPVRAVPPATQPVVVRPATQPVVAAIPTTMPAVAVAANQPPLPRPPTRHLKLGDEGLTDQEIGDAIGRGANFLLTQFNNGRLVGDNFRGDPGLNALCVYALLQCGQAVPDERLNGRAKGMKTMLDNLRNSNMSGYETYGRAIRATAVGLEESLLRYERGTFLIQHCQNILNTAEKQIELIGRNPNGEMKTTPLPEEPA